jgi:hypothetical protein
MEPILGTKGVRVLVSALFVIIVSIILGLLALGSFAGVGDNASNQIGLGNRDKRSQPLSEGHTMQPKSTLSSAISDKARQDLEQRLIELGIGEERLHIRTAEEWIALWRRFGREAPQEIDFQNSDVVLFLLGTQGSGGFSVQIVGVDHARDAAFVRVLVCRPLAGSANIAVLTFPYDARLTTKIRGPLNWVFTEGRSGRSPCL